MGLIDSTHSRSDSLFHKRLPYIGYQIEEPFQRRICYISLYAAQFNMIMSWAYIIYTMDLVLAAKISHTQITMMFGILIATIALSSVDMHFKIIGIKKKMWTFQEVGPEFVADIEEKYKHFQKQRLYTTVLLCIASTIGLPLSGDYKEFCPYMHGLEGVENEYISIILTVLEKFYIFYYAYLVISFSFINLFLLSEACFYISLLRKKLKLIEETYGSEERSYYDGKYQDYVRKTLKKIISQHILILRYVKTAKSTFEQLILLCFLTGTLCIAWLFFSTKMNMNIITFVKSVALQWSAFMIIAVFCQAGQLLIDECENLYRDLCECPWFIWNKSNKMSYLNLLTYAKDPVILKNFDLTLNLNLLVVFVRRTLSLFTAIDRVTSLH